MNERTILPAHIHIRKTREQLYELTGYGTVSVRQDGVLRPLLLEDEMLRARNDALRARGGGS